MKTIPIPDSVIFQLCWAVSDDGQELDLDAASVILSHEGFSDVHPAIQCAAIEIAQKHCRALYCQKVLANAGFVFPLRDLKSKWVIICVKGGDSAYTDTWMIRRWVDKGEPDPHQIIALILADMEAERGTGR